MKKGTIRRTALNPKGVLPLIGTLAVFCLLCGSLALADSRKEQEAEPETEKIVETVASGEVEDALTTPWDLLQAVELTDIPADSPAYDTARYMVSQDIMPETSENSFDPDSPITRAELAAALYRMSGSTAPAEATQFSDVPEDAWYAEAAAWAVSVGAADGGTTFGANELITRVQLAQILYRCAALWDYPTELAESLEAYQDGGSVPDSGKEAMSWALGNGFFRTVIADTIQPNVAVSRLQLAQALLVFRSASDPLADEILAKQPARTADSAARAQHDAIQAAVDSAAQKYGATSLQVAVVENGTVVDTYSYGWATKGEDPMTEAHKLRVASISKVAVGLAAMILREDGIISLDESIGTYWDCTVRNPYYPDSPITIRTLLTHTSSIYNAGDNVSRAYSSVKGQLSKGTCFTRMTPGAVSSWVYNNYGFSVLGLTLELASGQNLDTILKNRLYTPMDIDGAFYAGDIRGTDKLVTLYRDGAVTRSKSTQMNLHAGAPGESGIYFAGGLTTSAKDLAKLAAMLTEDGKYEGVRLLSEESVELMETHAEQAVSDGSYQAMPLRSRYNIYGRDKLYYHTGSAYGVFNCFSYDPVAKDGVVVLTVGASGAKDANGIYAVCGSISEYIYNAIK